jgi:hypothetical protein
MPKPSFEELVAGGLLLASLVCIFVAAKGRDDATLRLVARGTWTLRQLCWATPELQRSASTVDHVAIDLTLIPHLDGETLALLDRACRQWSDAGARVVIECCTGDLARAIRHRDIGADVQSSAPGREPA